MVDLNNKTTPQTYYNDLIAEYFKFVFDTQTKLITDPEKRIFWATDELSAEVGEVKGVLAKSQRKKKHLDAEDMLKLRDELGDVFWSFCATCLAVGIPLDEVINSNTEKLTLRMNKQKTA